ncbi:Fructosamine kinase-domain-containing protein [Whalleya microplaca]|nr:Fructosamine kinase-domain-containing protein [Whalleya microplaca]
MANTSIWVEGIKGNFDIHIAVVEVMPRGTVVISAEHWGLSAWTKTAKVCVNLPDGDLTNYFLKCVTGQLAETLMWGEHHSASTIEDVSPGFGPAPVGKGDYYDDAGTHVYFYLMNFHDMDLRNPPDPTELAASIARLHRNGTSPNGMFGYPVITGRGSMDRTVIWEKSWAKSFTHLLNDVIKIDSIANEPWSDYDAACKQLIDRVLPRLLGALEYNGRSIAPTLVHGDIWEGNVATDLETGKIAIFDPGCLDAHNEMEFSGWRCSWATHFTSPIYQMCYKQDIPPSEPEEEWDDRNRLYAIRAAICESAGHPGSQLRMIAYNDMLYLCEKYAPLDTLRRYDPEKDISVTGAIIIQINAILVIGDKNNIYI